MVVPPDTVTGQDLGGRPANRLDQATIAHPPGHKTAKAISASNADAESKEGVLARERSVIVMAEATVAGGGLDRRRWVLLWVIGLARLMVVPDLTVMNIALPSAQRALHSRRWTGSKYGASSSSGSSLIPSGS